MNQSLQRVRIVFFPLFTYCSTRQMRFVLLLVRRRNPIVGKQYVMNLVTFGIAQHALWKGMIRKEAMKSPYNLYFTYPSRVSATSTKIITTLNKPSHSRFTRRLHHQEHYPAQPSFQHILTLQHRVSLGDTLVASPCMYLPARTQRIRALSVDALGLGY